jgi:hypothetical protein
MKPQKYKVAGDRVGGRLVRHEIPNTSSISASLERYRVLAGIREVPFSAFGPMPPPRYYSQSEERRTKALAREIQISKEINPLVVVEDSKGPYILEGGHRFDALRELGAKSFPALVVVDLS